MVGESGRGGAQRLKNKRSSHEGGIDGASIVDCRVGCRMQSVSNDILMIQAAVLEMGGGLLVVIEKCFCEKKC